MCGNFYSNRFIPFLASEFTRLGVAALFVNTSGHDYIAESLVGDDPIFVGGTLTSQAAIDIDVRRIVSSKDVQQFDQVILSGHSFGCDVVCRNLASLETRVSAVILLSPADSRMLQREYRRGETPERQIQRLAKSKETIASVDLLPHDECGIASEGLRYPIPMSRSALVAFLSSGPGVFRFTEGAVDALDLDHVDAYVYLGDLDPMLRDQQGTARSLLSKTFRNVTFAKPTAGDHHFTGIESMVASDLGAWLGKVRRPSPFGVEET
jgi:pimeloyl-ACP methyl ester carboxylesterase